MKILLFGSSGMLGREITEIFLPIYGKQFYFCDRDECDIGNLKELKALFKSIKPNVIINAAGFTNVDKCEDCFTEANKINGHSNEYIINATKDFKPRIIYVSSDYVFDGQKQSGYMENDEPNPINKYGESKLLGEKIIQEKYDNYLIVRSSWLFSEYGNNFVKTMLKINKDELNIVDDQIGCPTYAKDLANGILKLIQDNSPTGIYHLVNSANGVKSDKGVSWFEFAKKIFKFAGIDIKLKPITSNKLDRKAKRPHYSILLNTKAGELRNYEDALKEVINKL